MLNKAPPLADPQTAFKVLSPLETPLNDLARLARAVSIIGESVRETLEAFNKPGFSSDLLYSTLKGDVEVLFAYIDDLDDNATSFRDEFYSAWRAAA